jgi:hypothetical protein
LAADAPENDHVIHWLPIMLCVFLKEMSKGPYAVVEFDGDTTCRVSFKRIFSGNGQFSCFWSDLRRRVEKLEIASPKLPVWTVNRVVARTGLLLRCCFQYLLNGLNYQEYNCLFFVQLLLILAVVSYPSISRLL